MTLPSPLPAFDDDTVTVLERVKTGEDAYGGDIFTEMPTPLVGVSVQPAQSTELMSNTADMVTDQWRLYGPAGLGLDASAHLLWRGLDLQVDGTPMEWPAPLAHTEARLIRYGG